MPVVRTLCPGGAPCRDNIRAFILACMSWGRPAPLRVETEGCEGAGRRAALIAPSGVEEEVMLVTGGGSVTVRKVGSRGALGEVG